MQSDWDQFSSAYALTSLLCRIPDPAAMSRGSVVLGGGGKVIDLELNFLLGVHDEFGESGHFVL